ncbi:MAG: hypothetical protein U9N49_02750 [Campylobacterota bacterium]|nr:hypothetical protein [Campylobacterota bacterium]
MKVFKIILIVLLLISVTLFILQKDTAQNTITSSSVELSNVLQKETITKQTTTYSNNNTIESPSFAPQNQQKDINPTLSPTHFNNPIDRVIGTHDKEGNAIALSNTPKDIVVGTHDEEGNAIALSNTPTDIVVGTHDKEGNAIALSNTPKDIVVGTHDEEGNAIALSPSSINKSKNAILTIEKSIVK